jgi:glycosyltransferase involved in cell wall biosynthesis
MQERQGQATAFNRGFAEARGEVVCLLDSDDTWRPEKFKIAAQAFSDSEVGLAEHYLEDTDVDLQPLPQRFPVWPERYRLQDFLAGRTEFTATSGLCIRRSLLKPIPKELFYYLDDYLVIGALFKSQAVNIRQVLGAHRVHGGNWCAGKLADSRKLATDLRMREILDEELQVWLDASGQVLTPRHRAAFEIETWRRRVLKGALEGRTREAWSLWRQGLSRFIGTGFGCFRLATVFLAVLSPAFYLRAYEFYARGCFHNLRRRLFPV